MQIIVGSEINGDQRFLVHSLNLLNRKNEGETFVCLGSDGVLENSIP